MVAHLAQPFRRGHCTQGAASRSRVGTAARLGPLRWLTSTLLGHNPATHPVAWSETIDASKPPLMHHAQDSNTLLVRPEQALCANAAALDSAVDGEVQWVRQLLA